MTTLPPTPSTRIVSLDVFRGGTVAAMILVNNPGSWDHVYWPLEHAEWDGCTPTDLIMPFFLFIVGVSIVYAMDSRKQKPAEQRALTTRVWTRALTLVALGLFLAIFPGSPATLNQLFHHPFDRLAELRLPGVLQRIGIVYLLCALLFLKTNPRIWIGALATLLVGYQLLLTVVPVPGPAGWIRASLSPGTDLGAYLDRLLLTPAHLYNHDQYDPEGLVSTLAACASGVIGLLAGHYLRRGSLGSTKEATHLAPWQENPATRVTWLFAAGLITLAVGWLWSLAIPLNKQLWTPSFTLHTGGLAILTLALCHWLFDIQGYRRFTTVFVAFGINAITAFFASGLLVRALNLYQLPNGSRSHGLKDYAYIRVLAPAIPNPALASLAAAVLFVLLWAAIMLFMSRRKWIIKV